MPDNHGLFRKKFYVPISVFFVEITALGLALFFFGVRNFDFFWCTEKSFDLTLSFAEKQL